VKSGGKGDRVALHHHVPCMKCHAAGDQSFANARFTATGITAGLNPPAAVLRVRRVKFIRHVAGSGQDPSGNSFEEALLLEAGQKQCSKPCLKLKLLEGVTAHGDRQGPIGLMFTRLLHLRGISVVASDPSRSPG